MAKRALILLGPPGAGKGTQARMLAARTESPSISTGEVLRQEVQRHTELGERARKLMEAGELVPDGLVNEIIRGRIVADGGRPLTILDGYPRTVSQAEFLEDLAGREGIQTLAIGIMVDDEALVGRLSRRWNCPRCGKIHNGGPDAEGEHGRCDECGATLIQRSDDRPEVIRERLQVYHRLTQPLIDFYRRRERYVAVDGEGTPERIFGLIVDILEKQDRAAEV